MKKMKTNVFNKESVKIGDYELTYDDHGFTLWVVEGSSRHWILDASCFVKDEEISLDVHSSWKTKLAYNKKFKKLVLKK